MNISLLNSSGVVLPHLTQYDQNITLVCEDIDALDISSAPEFHFFNSKSSEMLRVQSTISDNKLNVHIPNILLIQPQTIIADIYTIDANEVGKCIYSMKIPITGRPVPSDFIYADDSGLIVKFPIITPEDEGKVLTVVNGTPQWAEGGGGSGTDVDYTNLVFSIIGRIGNEEDSNDNEEENEEEVE